MGDNICFKEYYGKLSLNYPFYPFLSAALLTMKIKEIKLVTHTDELTYGGPCLRH